MNTSTGRMRQRTMNALERENGEDTREKKNIIETFMHGTLYVGASIKSVRVHVRKRYNDLTNERKGKG